LSHFADYRHSIAFFRQVIGIKAFGILYPGHHHFRLPGDEPDQIRIIIFVTVIAMVTFVRFLLKQFRLLYLPGWPS